MVRTSSNTFSRMGPFAGAASQRASLSCANSKSQRMACHSSHGRRRSCARSCLYSSKISWQRFQCTSTAASARSAACASHSISRCVQRAYSSSRSRTRFRSASAYKIALSVNPCWHIACNVRSFASSPPARPSPYNITLNKAAKKKTSGLRFIRRPCLGFRNVAASKQSDLLSGRIHYDARSRRQIQTPHRPRHRNR